MLTCHLYATSLRNPNVQASGDPLQSKEDDDKTNMLSLGVKLLPKLVTTIEEHFKKTTRKIESDKFRSQHCSIVYSRTGLHVENEQISGHWHPSVVVRIIPSRIGRTY